jgi:hypothetical protein
VKFLSLLPGNQETGQVSLAQELADAAKLSAPHPNELSSLRNAPLEHSWLQTQKESEPSTSTSFYHRPIFVLKFNNNDGDLNIHTVSFLSIE